MTINDVLMLFLLLASVGDLLMSSIRQPRHDEHDANREFAFVWAGVTLVCLTQLADFPLAVHRTLLGLAATCAVAFFWWRFRRLRGIRSNPG